MIDPEMSRSSYTMESIAMFAKLASRCVRINSSERPLIEDCVKELQLIFHTNSKGLSMAMHTFRLLWELIRVNIYLARKTFSRTLKKIVKIYSFMWTWSSHKIRETVYMYILAAACLYLLKLGNKTERCQKIIISFHYVQLLLLSTLKLYNLWSALHIRGIQCFHY